MCCKNFSEMFCIQICFYFVALCPRSWRYWTFMISDDITNFLLYFMNFLMVVSHLFILVTHFSKESLTISLNFDFNLLFRRLYCLLVSCMSLLSLDMIVCYFSRFVENSYLAACWRRQMRLLVSVFRLTYIYIYTDF